MPELRFLGWNALQVRLGRGTGPRVRWAPLALDWQPGDIRNCSYAPEPGWIGITAEDRTHGRQLLAVYDLHARTTQVLLRLDYVLQHALSPSGAQVCYTQPSAIHGAADLYLFDTDSRQARRLAEGGAAQDSTPAWFADESRLVYHSPGQQIELFDIAEDSRRVLTAGRCPAVSADGQRIALQRGDEILIWSGVTEDARPLRSTIERKPVLADGLSWSPDMRFLSFGAVGGLSDKQTSFYLVEIAEGVSRKIEAKYLRGLTIVG